MATAGTTPPFFSQGDRPCGIEIRFCWFCFIDSISLPFSFSGNILISTLLFSCGLLAVLGAHPVIAQKAGVGGGPVAPGRAPARKRSRSVMISLFLLCDVHNVRAV